MWCYQYESLTTTEHLTRKENAPGNTWMEAPPPTTRKNVLENIYMGFVPFYTITKWWCTLIFSALKIVLHTINESSRTFQEEDLITATKYEFLPHILICSVRKSEKSIFDLSKIMLLLLCILCVLNICLINIWVLHLRYFKV